MLAYNPAQRISSADALEHPYFKQARHAADMLSLTLRLCDLFFVVQALRLYHTLLIADDRGHTPLQT